MLLKTLEEYGVGRRRLDDQLFVGEKPPPRLGVYDLDEENLCHEVITTTCNIPGCKFVAESLLEFESHYNASHRYSCGQCKKVLPSPHLLDLHIQENHDSFFAVMAERKPSYCCYIEECKDKFVNTEQRLEHCVKCHKLPKDFRFEQKPKNRRKQTLKKKNQDCDTSMDLDVNARKNKSNFLFTNNKQKVFPAYTGKKFTKNSESKNNTDVDMDKMMEDIKESLPE